MAKRKQKTVNEQERKRHHGHFALAIIIAVMAVIIAVLAFNQYEEHKKIELKTETESELIKVMKESNLYTAEYPYNGYTSVKDDKGKVKYYVAYNGTVKAGFDVNKVKVNADIDNSIITIQLPKVTILSSTVDTNSLSYIFEDKKYQTETVASEANQMANKDLAQKASSYKEIVNVGTDNAKNIEKSLAESWVNYPGSKVKYKVRVLSYEEAKNDQTTSS